MKIQVLRTSGIVEEHDVHDPEPLEWCRKAIGADVLDSVNLRDGRLMLVDDLGHVEGRKPGRRSTSATPLRVNARATALYWSVCKPGTTHRIVGDAAIVVDEDLA